MATREELIKLCRYYKGEEECPEYLHEIEGKCWASEQACCEFFAESIHSEQAFLNLFAAHLTKWDPYQGREALKAYLQLRPSEYDNQLLATYEL